MSKFIKDGDYYYPGKILSLGYKYNLIFGGRSDGKTTGGLHWLLENYLKTGQRFVYSRKTDAQLEVQRDDLFSKFNSQGWIKDMSDGEFTHIERYGSRYYLATLDESTGMSVKESQPFCQIHSIRSSYKMKGIVFDNYKWLFLDEYLEPGSGVANEFSSFLNMISTISRDDGAFRIIMAANSIATESLYYKNMGITNVLEMEQGHIYPFDMIDPKTGDLYKGIGVEYVRPFPGGKASDVLYGFVGSKQSMITTGAFDMPDVALVDIEKVRKHIRRTMHLISESTNLRGHVVKDSGGIYILIERITDIEDQDITDVDFIYKIGVSKDPRTFINPYDNYGDPFTKMVSTLLMQGRIFFTDPIAAHSFNNYIDSANNFSSTK